MLRAPVGTDLDPLSDLWFEGWINGHKAIVPPELTALRTRENFRARLIDKWDQTFVTGPEGAPTGFVRLIGNEVDQFYVHPSAVGTGLAAKLMAASEAELSAQGVKDAFLICSVGNDRAARFYTKSGWTNTGAIRAEVTTSAGPFALDVWRFEKTL